METLRTDTLIVGTYIAIIAIIRNKLAYAIYADIVGAKTTVIANDWWVGALSCLANIISTQVIVAAIKR